MNGDSKQVVKLLSDRIDDLGRRFDSNFNNLQKRQDDIIASFNNYKDITKLYIDEKHKNQQTQIDNHCPRIRALEKYKSTIGGIVIAITFLVSGIWSVITYLTK